MLRIALLQTIGVLALATGGRTDAASTYTQCPVRHSRTLLIDRAARVYIAPDPSEPEFHEVFACANGYGSFILENVAVYEEPSATCANGCPPAHGSVALAGAMVGYAETEPAETKYGNCFCGAWHVAVRDLRTGRVVHRAPTGGTKLAPTTKPYTVPEPGDYVGVGPAVDVVVRPNGSVAWIAKNLGYDGMQAGYEVHVLDRHGRRILAHSPHIAPRSLKLIGDEIHWVEDGVTMSSTIR
jgi:hypothetical protein